MCVLHQSGRWSVKLPVTGDPQREPRSPVGQPDRAVTQPTLPCRGLTGVGPPHFWAGLAMVPCRAAGTIRRAPSLRSCRARILYPPSNPIPTVCVHCVAARMCSHICDAHHPPPNPICVPTACVHCVAARICAHVVMRAMSHPPKPKSVPTSCVHCVAARIYSHVHVLMRMLTHGVGSLGCPPPLRLRSAAAPRETLNADAAKSAKCPARHAVRRLTASAAESAKHPARQATRISSASWSSCRCGRGAEWYTPSDPQGMLCRTQQCL